MLQYNDFTEHIKSNIKDYLPAEYQNATVSIEDVIKNNDTILQGLNIVKAGQNIAPTIYLNNFYNDLVDGKSTYVIMKEIAKIRVENDINSFQVDRLQDYEYVKDKIVYKLINHDRNKKLLSTTPHKDFGDLSAIYQVNLGEYEDGNATLVIHDSMLDAWGVSEKEIALAAEKNTPIINPYMLRPMSSIIIEEMTGEKIDPANEELEQMNVLTCESKINGASTILYPGLLDKISERMGGNYYVIPSTIHEVLIVEKLDGMSAQDLKEMISIVNNECVDSEEVLGSSVYEYDEGDRALYIADSHQLVLRSADLEHEKTNHKGKLQNKMFENLKEQDKTFNEPEIEM